MSSALGTVANGFDYPHPDSIDRLRRAVTKLDPGPVRGSMERFVGAVRHLDLGAWEELHTRTVDLSPMFVPYVGHAAWGENYRRGVFMADLQAAIWSAGVDQHGELPDHIAPILRLLATGSHGPADLREVLPAAVATMRKDLKKADPDNPYRHLLAAAAAAIASHLSEGVPA